MRTFYLNVRYAFGLPRLAGLPFGVVFVGGAEQYACGADCEECAVFYDAPFAVAKYFVVYKSACVAWGVAQYVA